jgi:N-acetylmuramoyl-L-alanine amidase-like protein
MKGSAFAAQIGALPPGPQRDAAIYKAVLDGYAVDWPLVRVPVGQGCCIEAPTDYFAIGEPDDFLRLPLDGALAQHVADHLGRCLPSTRVVDAIWLAADVSLRPMPMTPDKGFPYDGSMESVARFVIHNQWINDYLLGRPGLVAGHKKDVVISNRLLERTDLYGPLIYGWQQENGVPIQPLSAAHRNQSYYADYSHGVRLCAPIFWQADGTYIALEQAYADPRYAPLLGEMGPLRITRYAPIPLHAMPLPAPSKPIVAPVPHPPSSPATPPVVQPLRTTGDFADIAFVQAEQYKAVQGRPIDLIVLHTAEIAEIPRGAENVAQYFKRPRAADGSVVTASSTFTIDADSEVQCVLLKDVAYAAPGANHNGIQIELSGYAKQSAADWSDPYSTAMLARLARLVARLCKLEGIPVQYVDATQLAAGGARGITTHRQVSLAFKKSNHVDPGGSFPMDAFLAAVRRAIVEDEPTDPGHSHEDAA